jgi:hypothetical protein
MSGVFTVLQEYHRGSVPKDSIFECPGSCGIYTMRGLVSLGLKIWLQQMGVGANSPCQRHGNPQLLAQNLDRQFNTFLSVILLLISLHSL